MNPEHATLLKEIRRAARPTRSTAAPQNDSYGGSGRPFYNVSVPQRRSIARHWLAAHKTMTPEAFLSVVDSLFDGQSHEEKTLAALLVAYNAGARREVDAEAMERWLGRLNGWAEIDSFCQNVFTAEEMIGAWRQWERLIGALSKDSNINKRRASMVLLNGPVHYSDDARFRDLAFVVIDRLRAERPILITKAVSWLLRSMVARHRDALQDYLSRNAASLPRIAVRETRAKLATGVKSGRSRSNRASVRP